MSTTTTIYKDKLSISKIRICFLHPDLGLGGAERLIVDAASGLASRGHSISIFTNHYDSGRSFAETRDGSFDIYTRGDWIPRSLFGGLHILCANFQNAWLAISVSISSHLFGNNFDVIVCDQVSMSVPLIRLLLPSTAIVFYCHFPDQLLSKRSTSLMKIYRAPFDLLEEITTGLADAIVVNSGFTSKTFLSTFLRLGFHRPQILYPCVAVQSSSSSLLVDTKSNEKITENKGKMVFLSINRFERKKNIGLAIRAVGLLRKMLSSSEFEKVHLIIAGGYDQRLPENVEHHLELIDIAKDVGLVDILAKKGPGRRKSSGSINTSVQETSSLDFKTDLESIKTVIPGWSNAPIAPNYDQVQVGSKVTFIRSFSDLQKAEILRACSAVLYTPENEHFGIVPLECGAARRPVIACNSGGPLESIIHWKTGFLCDPTPDSFATAMATLVKKPDVAEAMGIDGRLHVEKSFSRDKFSAVFETILVDTMNTLWSTRRSRCLQRFGLFAIMCSLFIIPIIPLLYLYLNGSFEN